MGVQHPDLQQRLKEGLARLRATADPMLASVLVAKKRKPVGMDDGLIFPGVPSHNPLQRTGCAGR